MTKFNLSIDCYTGLAVSIFIVVTAIRSLRETVDPLLGTPADIEIVEEIKKLTINYKGRDVPAQKVGNGFVFNVNVWNEGGAMNIEINGQDGIFNGTK